MSIKKTQKNTKSQQYSREQESKLRKYASMPVEAVFKELDSTKNGVKSSQVAEKQSKYGKNIITTSKKNTVGYRIKEAFVNPFNIVLFLIGLFSLFSDAILVPPLDEFTHVIVFTLIFISGTVAFVQSGRSNAAAEKLSKMISNKTEVYRNGKLVEILLDEVVIGDVVKLSAGNIIPADVRFLTAKDAFIAQAALTGESNPVEKLAKAGGGEDAITDLQNIGFMGSNMVSGSATAIVLATGNNTFFGSMAESLSEETGQSSFERGVDSVSKLLLQRTFIMVPIVFVIILVKIYFNNNSAWSGSGGSWIDAMLFAITIAIGLTPEMLPMIMTSTLAKGAVSMSKRKVIVKNLSAIQTFGEMDVLCTDKTGTLTEDKIVLEKYMNISGETDMRILHHAYLNSHFQTGLKNLMDIAIIHRAEKNNLVESTKEFSCVDEIPFDFTRRRMSVVLQDKLSRNRLLTKGAVEEVVSISSFLEIDGNVVPLTEENKRIAMETYEKNNNDGLRMIAVAQKFDVAEIDKFDVDDEKDMILIGFIGFLDPPKESAAAAITALKEHGVRTVVLTGDSEGVAIKVCKKVGIDTTHSYTGKEVEKMSDTELSKTVKECNLFAKLTPAQKSRVVKMFKSNGHTVGYMGDGINDAPPMHQADVSISVDSAVDIAKETANIILLKKDLMVLNEGVLEGRKTFGNIIKYIKMASSGNFGNMLSVIFASIFFPFIPLQPVQILTQNLLCDFSQLGIPFDNVDEEFLKKPRKWETKSIKSFMSFMGPLSSFFDLLCFAVMWWIIGANTTSSAPLFQCGWFIFGTISQMMVIHMIRTAKIPFIQSKPSLGLCISTFTMAIVPLLLGFTGLASTLFMSTPPLKFVPWLIALLLGYCVASQIFKKIYVKIHSEWL